MKYMQKQINILKEKLLPEVIEQCYREEKNIAVVFDTNLTYLAANKNACEQLGCNVTDLIGNSIIDLYPHIIASENHRHLLTALEGEIVSAMLHLNGSFYKTTYFPIKTDRKTLGLFVLSQKTS